MKEVFYKIIYQSAFNRLLRSINKFLLPVLPKWFRLPPSGQITLKLQPNKKLILCTNQTNYLTQLVYWEDFRKFEYTSLFLELSQNIRGFLDIGANIGYYSLLAAKQNPLCKVIAFEPAKGPLYYLRKNVEVNSLNNIQVASLALSEQEGSITFHEVKSRKYPYLKYNLAGTGSAATLNKGEDFTSNTVSTTTLDTYAASIQFPIDLIKMDTEGTEHLILQEGLKALTKHQPIVICETLFQTNETALETIFHKLGYECYNHYPEGLRLTKSIQRTVDNGIRNCFFVPPSKKHLINAFIVS
ncbi:FkbM family methyltransferase [Mongoliitalea daihaiensis]|uniref:FkbM family methyltransferase n=1 Tax=Mongoliitalea daihaiensis TaxID=2782006 RepID=UPI001EFFF3F8|nr:FkbM family methyltransferase [Mongoliitalea daihaiensis]UJP64411.1 FkbM family methyltransferase [Mongoliitalea daihaiensis]